VLETAPSSKESSMANFNVPTGFISVTRTVSTTALALTDFSGITAAILGTAMRLRLTVNTNSANFLYSGSDPTVSAGHNIPTNGTLILDGNQNLVQFKIIRSGGSDASVTVTLERYSG
jgi:hypothetical protein